MTPIIISKSDSIPDSHMIVCESETQFGIVPRSAGESVIFNSGNSEGAVKGWETKHAGQDPDAERYQRVVEAIQQHGTPYKRDLNLPDANGESKFHSIVRGLRLGSFKLEGDTLKSKAFKKHGRESETVNL